MYHIPAVQIAIQFLTIQTQYNNFISTPPGDCTQYACISASWIHTLFDPKNWLNQTVRQAAQVGRSILGLPITDHLRLQQINGSFVQVVEVWVLQGILRLSPHEFKTVSQRVFLQPGVKKVRMLVHSLN